MNGEDYNETTVDVEFIVGDDTEMCLNITIEDDVIVENDEDFLVIASSTSSGLEFGQATVTIEDNEG